MASGPKISQTFQKNKYGYQPHQSLIQTNDEFMEDIRLKMSKKIAQLTKVIYALNTKNDENESFLQALREQHENEIQLIISETKHKLAEYKECLDKELYEHLSISDLQKKLCLQQHKYTSTEEQFSQYKIEVQERQQKENDNFSAKVDNLSQELLESKKKFEEQSNAYLKWKEKIESHYTSMVAELIEKYESEIRNVHDSYKSQDEIDILRSEIKMLHEQKVELKEEFALKLEKAQAFYEKELQANRHEKLEEKQSELEILRKELENVRSVYRSNDIEMRNQIESLVQQLADTEDKLENSINQHRVLQDELSGKESNAKDLLKELQDVKVELSTKSCCLHNLESESAVLKQHSLDLNDELRKKSDLVSQLEAQNMQNERMVASLQSEMDMMNVKLRQIEKERDDKTTEHHTLSSEQTSELQRLKQTLETIARERDAEKKELERQMNDLKEASGRKEQELIGIMSKKVAEMEKEHKDEQEKQSKSALEILQNTKECMLKDHQLQYETLKEENVSLQNELATLQSRLSAADNEVYSLRKCMEEKESGLDSVSSQVTVLNNIIAQLRTDLESLNMELVSSKALAANLQVELDEEKLMHTNKLKEIESTMKERLEKSINETEERWKSLMSSQSEKLYMEISSQKEKEKNAALTELLQVKDKEIEMVKTDSKTELTNLHSKIEKLHSEMESNLASFESEKLKLEQELEKEKSLFDKKFIDSNHEYATKISDLERLCEDKIRQQENEKTQEKLVLENELREMHKKQMQDLRESQKTSIDCLKQVKQKEKEKELNQLKLSHQEQQDNLCQRLEAEKQHSLDLLSKSHSMALQTAKIELDRAVQISKQKDVDHQISLEDLRAEIGHRDQHIRNMQDQLNKAQTEMDNLKKSLERKGLEIIQLREKQKDDLRSQKERLNQSHMEEMDKLSSDHLEEQQGILSQFKDAHDMLKDKISSLQMELEEAELKYQERESRPEDLELIENLRCEVSDCENRIKDLIDEKRFYQLELVNRETNFNKVFNTHPNVGVLDPFQKSKKKGERLSKLQGLATGGALFLSQQKLDPLPGSPMHDSKLNPSKPLPQPNFSKKFVR